MARVDEPVLIEGAPGTGIAKVADVIHLQSSRTSGPFIRVSGASLLPDRMQKTLDEAATGTIFIEEFGALSTDAQYALLAQLETGSAARILAGTTADPIGKTIPELYFRLETLRARIPPVLERPEDIPIIFRHYVNEVAEQYDIVPPDLSEDFIADLMARDWPGNTQSLMNVATRFVLGLEEPLSAKATGLVAKLAQNEKH